MFYLCFVFGRTFINLGSTTVENNLLLFFLLTERYQDPVFFVMFLLSVGFFVFNSRWREHGAASLIAAQS